jgi:hypothetical protein
LEAADELRVREPPSPATLERHQRCDGLAPGRHDYLLAGTDAPQKVSGVVAKLSRRDFSHHATIVALL